MDIARLRIASTARKHVGSRAWMLDVAKDEFDAGKNKCNKFVFDIIVESKAKPLPTIPKYLIFSRPPLAREWADPLEKIAGWVVVETPAPGDVIAVAHESTYATGHVGIVVGDRLTVSANSRIGGIVDMNDWGFRSGDRPTYRRLGC